MLPVTFALTLLKKRLLSSPLAFSNSIDRALVALGLDRKKADEVLDLGRYLEEKAKANSKTEIAEGKK